MSIFRKPSEMQPKYALAALIYGSPGSGKTTLACSSPNAVLLDYDGGATRIHGVHRVPTLQVSSWEQTQEALNEIRQTPEIQSIVIDTIGKMLTYMEDYIKRHPSYTKGGNPIEFNRDGALTLKGFGKRKAMFQDFVKAISIMGKHVIFVAHDREDKVGDDIIVRPEVAGAAYNDLLKELDLVGYVEMVGDKRTISFTPCEKFVAKNTCNMPGQIDIPVTIDKNDNPIHPNDFMVGVITAYQHRQTESIQKGEKYKALCAEIAEKAKAIKDAKSANAFRKWALSVEPIYNSNIVIANALKEATEKLGLTQNAETKEYADTKK
jgi:hypothetical protein